MSERPKQKRDARRDHDCGVCAWVTAVISDDAVARLLAARNSHLDDAEDARLHRRGDPADCRDPTILR
jgi:hypothetical protein